MSTDRKRMTSSVTASGSNLQRWSVADCTAEHDNLNLILPCRGGYYAAGYQAHRELGHGQW